MSTESNLNIETVPGEEGDNIVTQAPKKRKKLSDKKGMNKEPVETGDQVDVMLLQTLKNLDNNPSEDTKMDENDPDVMFCRSLINRLKELPKKKNSLARMKIEEVLFKIEFDDEQ